MRRAIMLYRRFQHFESRVAGVLGISAGCILLSSCATSLRIQTDSLPEGSLRLAEVVYVATRSETTETKALYEALLSSGIKDSEIMDGSVLLARVYCCGNPMAADQNLMLYTPPKIGVGKGDIVELRSGRPPAQGDSGRLNTVMRIRQKSGEGATSCNWIPPDPRLWARILYCDWMPSEGWVERGGINKAWFKPAVAQSLDDWVDIKDPNELRALYSNKTFRGNTWVGHYRADGKGILIPQGVKPQSRTWEVKGNDLVCVAAGFGPANCYRFQRNSKKPNEFVAISVTTGTTLNFTVEDGVPEF